MFCLHVCFMFVLHIGQDLAECAMAECRNILFEDRVWLEESGREGPYQKHQSRFVEPAPAIHVHRRPGAARVARSLYTISFCEVRSVLLRMTKRNRTSFLCLTQKHTLLNSTCFKIALISATMRSPSFCRMLFSSSLEICPSLYSCLAVAQSANR